MSPSGGPAGPSLVLFAALALSACTGPAPQPPSGSRELRASAVADPDPALAEFQAIADRIRDGENAWLGLRPKRAIAQRLERVGLDMPTRYQLLMQLSVLEVREGEVEAGAAHVDEAGALLEQMLPRVPEQARDGLLGDYHRARAVAYMRQAELGNCVAQHSPEGCILPLEGGGVHVNPLPSIKSLESWRAILELRPGDLEARWFVNVLEMTLGRHPAGVAPERRLDFSARQSKTRVRRRRDVAALVGLDRLDLAGGVAIEDFDGDGRLDIVTSSSDPDRSLAYFHNAGDAGFEERTREAGLSGQLGGLNLVSTDHDGDGDADLLVLRGAWLLEEGRIRNSLLENDGRGRFTDVTRRAGLAEPAYPTQAAAWADFDGDGDLDLFVGNEVHFVGRNLLEAFPSQLFRNEGDGTFTDVAVAAGVTNDAQAKGVTVGDYDDDGDLDLFVSNIGANRLYRNDGGLRFTDVAVEAGVVEPVGRSFVPWFFDFDHDGDLDLWVPGYQGTTADVAADLLGLPHRAERPRLYRNLGGGRFEDAASELGLDRAFLPMGSNFGDLDGDGWLDIYLGTGDPEFTSLMPNVMLRNDRGRRFEDVTFASGLGHLQKGHGVAFADLDDDGDLDLFHQLGGFYRSDGFRNALFPDTGEPGRFLYLKLVGTRSNRHGLGARLRLELDTPAGPRTLHRAPGSVSSFGGSPLLRHEISLGDATAIRRLEILWPASGLSQAWRDLPLDALLTLTEGQEDYRSETLEPIRWDSD